MPPKNLKNDTAEKADTLLIFDTLQRLHARAVAEGATSSGAYDRLAHALLDLSPATLAAFTTAGMRALAEVSRHVRDGDLPELGCLLTHGDTAEDCQCRPRPPAYYCPKQGAWQCERCGRTADTETARHC
jgi:fermentation-respiration switch protein FrsA (DUF1100 family)